LVAAVWLGPTPVSAGQVDAGASRCVDAGPVDPSDLLFVNITNANVAGRGFATLRSSGAVPSDSDSVSSVNFAAGTPPNPNLAPVVVGSDGRICYDGAVGAHDMILDRLGVLAAGASVELAPRRLVDTRLGSPLADGESACATVSELDPGDLAVVNITPIRATGRGYGSLRASDDVPIPQRSEPDRFSSVNFASKAAPNPNLAVATVGSDSAICYDASVSTHHVALDLVAGIVAERSARLDPIRVLDTRRDAALEPESSRCVALDRVDVGGDGPSIAPGDLAIVNITPVRAAGRGYGALRSSDSRPIRDVSAAERFSSVNFANERPPDPNLSVVIVGEDATVCYDAAVSTHHVVLDLVGAVAAEAVRPIAPQRLADTRPTSSTCTSPLDLERGAMSSGQLREFSDDEFQRVVDLTSGAGIRTGTPPSITGDPAADARIRALAEARGYRQRVDVGSAGLVSVDGLPVGADTGLAFRSLQRSARAAGYSIRVGSAYRSVARQRAIFVSKLQARGISAASVRSGRADAAIDSILQFSSVPGYSRHHTGAAIDLAAGGTGINGFGGTAAYRWMAADNFAEAKRHGFVPSYPAGAGAQGPRPEPWEFVFVGVGSLIDTREFGQLDTIRVAEGRITAVGAFARTEQSIEIFVDETRVAVATAGCVETGESGLFRLAASVTQPLPPTADVCVIGGRSTTRRLLGCLP
jgi:hypothetical protein